jgi:hypothetical protein
VTVYTFQPEFERGPSLPGKLLRLVQDPIGTFASDVSTHHQESKKNSGIFPVQVDDEYDTVTVVQPGQIGSLFKIGKESNLRRAAEAQAALQRTYDAGHIVPGVPRGYQQFAADIAGIGAARLANPRAPEQPAGPGPNTRQNFMGGFIPPGGVMGFAQMTPSSQLALTRGARGTRRTTSRRKRKSASTGRRKISKRRGKSTTRRVKRSSRKRLVKGSAAAKRYMAKIRRKRK